MKHKTKLIATLMAICLVITLGVFGILAVKTLNMSVGGNITFNAEGLDFSISNGTFETTAGAEYPGVNGDSTKLKGFAMNTNTKESSIATQKASWTGLNLTMSSLGDVVLVFTVTNNMAANLVTTIEVTTLGTNTNNNMEINVVGGTVTKGTPKKMSITFHVKDTSINAGLTGFGVAVSFATEGQAGGGNRPGSTQDNPVDATTLPTLTFTQLEETTASVDVANATGEIVIPAYVKIDGKTYAVVKIDTCLKEGVTAEGVTALHIPSTFDAQKTSTIHIPTLETLYFESDPSAFLGKIWGLFNYTKQVYVRSDITVTSSYFQKQAESDVEGYNKYTETYSNTVVHGGGSN